jgi:Leucine-rich repeat (LRR) protein
LVASLATVACAADPADVATARKRVEAVGAGAACVVDPSGTVTEIVIADGSGVTAEDVALFGRLEGLEKLQILNCREFDDAMVSDLKGLTRLTSLAITNSGITDAAVETIAASFPDLVELDLSSNTNLTGAAMKSIAALPKLERLSLVQTRFNDLNTRRLSKLGELKALDLRGNMEAGDMTLGVVGGLPNLRAFKHRSTVVTDDGMAQLAASPALDSLLAQDFAITNASGPHLAAMKNLTSLEIFRCQGFGTEGVLALAPLHALGRLTLRDLPEVGDAGLAVLADLPALKRLYLHELASVGDAGLANLAAAKNLEVLDIWSVPKMTDATAAVIAGLPNLRELSIRETGCTEKAIETFAAMPKLESLTFKNGDVPPAVAEKAKAAKAWKKLDLAK